jgi:hypothetical protein
MKNYEKINIKISINPKPSKNRYVEDKTINIEG